MQYRNTVNLGLSKSLFARRQVLYTGPELPPHFLRVLVDVVKSEGVGALYRGIGPTLLRTFPATGALFYAMESTKKFLHATCLSDDDDVT